MPACAMSQVSLRCLIPHICAYLDAASLFYTPMYHAEHFVDLILNAFSCKATVKCTLLYN